MSTGFNAFYSELLAGNLDFSPDGGLLFSVMLMNEDYVPLGTHKHISDISSYEIDGTGYARIILNNVILEEDDTENLIKIIADDISLGTLGVDNGIVSGLVVFIDKGDDSLSIPMCFINVGFPLEPDGSEIEYSWDGWVATFS